MELYRGHVVVGAETAERASDEPPTPSWPVAVLVKEVGGKKVVQLRAPKRMIDAVAKRGAVTVKLAEHRIELRRSDPAGAVRFEEDDDPPETSWPGVAWDDPRARALHVSMGENLGSLSGRGRIEVQLLATDDVD